LHSAMREVENCVEDLRRWKRGILAAAPSYLFVPSRHYGITHVCIFPTPTPPIVPAPPMPSPPSLSPIPPSQKSRHR